MKSQTIDYYKKLATLKVEEILRLANAELYLEVVKNRERYLYDSSELRNNIELIHTPEYILPTFVFDSTYRMMIEVKSENGGEFCCLPHGIMVFTFTSNLTIYHKVWTGLKIDNKRDLSRTTYPFFDQYYKIPTRFFDIDKGALKERLSLLREGVILIDTSKWTFAPKRDVICASTGNFHQSSYYLQPDIMESVESAKCFITLYFYSYKPEEIKVLKPGHVQFYSQTLGKYIDTFFEYYDIVTKTDVKFLGYSVNSN